jgi:hypothetical protein
MISTGGFNHIQPSTYHPASAPITQARMVPISIRNTFVSFAGITDSTEVHPGKQHEPYAPG